MQIRRERRNRNCLTRKDKLFSRELKNNQRNAWKKNASQKEKEPKSKTLNGTDDLFSIHVVQIIVEVLTANYKRGRSFHLAVIVSFIPVSGIILVTAASVPTAFIVIIADRRINEISLPGLLGCIQRRKIRCKKARRTSNSEEQRAKWRFGSSRFYVWFWLFVKWVGTKGHLIQLTCLIQNTNCAFWLLTVWKLTHRSHYRDPVSQYKVFFNVF